MTNEPLFVSAPRAARDLSISVVKVREMANSGELRGCQRAGRKYLIPVREIKRLAGEPTEQGHEALSSRPEQAQLVKQIRRKMAEVDALLAELE